ncbi:MAG: type II secretion system F family protein [Candidatus Altiarchaeota archaeon]
MLNRIAQKLGEKVPNLREELDAAGIWKGAVEYLSEALAKASLMALLAFAGSALAFILAGKPKPMVSVLISVFAFAFILLLFIQKPRQMMKSRAHRIEQSLIFSLHAINIELESGIRFGQAVQDVAERDYGEFSREMRRVIDEAQKYGLTDAFERSARRNPSKIYRRTVWQIVNSLDTGADIHSNLKSIINDLRREQENEAQRYARTMEKQMTLYIMGGIVFPALAVAIIQTVSTIGASQNLAQEPTYWAILMASLAVQILFLYIIKFRKPTLLAEPVMRTKKEGSLTGHMKATLEYAGVDTPWKQYVLLQMLLSLAAGITVAIILEPHIKVGYATLIAVTTTLTAVTLYTRLAYMGDKRGLKAAEYLPDSLRIMAANMQAGIAADQALFMSARKEFGVLGEEIQLMGTDMLKNLTFEEALEKLKRRIKSEPLHLSVNLISHGLKAGRGLSDSLFHIADILQDRDHIRQNIATQLSAIRTTVLILVVISAPLLYSCSIVSGHIMGRFNQKLATTLPEEIVTQSWIHPGSASVTMEFLNRYIMVNLLATSLLGSIIVGEVTTGRARDGLRYMLIMLMASEILYIILKTVLMARIGGAFA